MNENLYKATSTFIDAMRLFEVSFIQQCFPRQDWEEVLLGRFKAKQVTSWNNRSQMLDEGTDHSVLIYFDNLQGFALGFREELSHEGVMEYGTVSSVATWLDEIHQTRNKLSHHNPIDEDEVSNAFYKMKQIAKLLHMTELVDELDRLKAAKPVDETATPAASAPQQPVVQVDLDSINESDPIPAWFNNVIPHWDIRNGTLDESVFAANLNEVANGTGQEVYLDPMMFFAKTYITAGLRDIANRVIVALNGGETENRVISLQTGFGGGKTHSLITLYHIAKAGKDLMLNSYAKSILNVGVKPEFENAKVAVFTNNTLDVVQGHTVEEGVHIHTIWGELAYRLGGKAGYEKVRANDEKLIAPTDEVFKPVLAEAAPALILVDELADYCNKAAGITVGNSTLSDQTISFMQMLTEAVPTVRKSVLITTLPSSSTEVAGSPIGNQILSALEARVIRVGTNIKPVDDNEIFEVIRRRLFESIGEKQTIEYIVQRYRKYYNSRKAYLPAYANDGTYPDLIRKSYPFHPEVINMFHLRWAQDNRFQRTRGVLRLLASIVKDLWERRSSLVGSNGLIQTSDLNLANLPTLTGTIANLKGSQWDTVLNADVMGTVSNSYHIDNEDVTSDLYKYRIAQGVATTVMLASIGGHQRVGIDLKELKLCMMRPAAFNHSFIDTAIGKLETSAHYLYSSHVGEAKYWFEARPNVNILLNQAKADIATSAIKTEIKNRLVSGSGYLSNFSKIMIEPSADIPEQKNLALVIFGPDTLTSATLNEGVKAKIKKIATTKGNSPRVYRNTMLFLLCTEHGYAILSEKIKDFLACKKILDEYAGSLEKDQKSDVTDRKATFEREIETALIGAYTTAVKYRETQGIEMLSIHPVSANLRNYLTNDVFNTLVEEEWIIKSIGRNTLSDAGLYPTVEKPVRVKDVLEAFLRYDDKPMISGRQAVIDCVSNYCRVGEFNVGYGTAPDFTHIDEHKALPFLNPEDEGVWIIDKTIHQQEPQPTLGPEPGPTPGPAPTPEPPEPTPGPESVKTFKSLEISGIVPIENWTYLWPSFINMLKNNRLQIEVKFTAKNTETSPLTETSQTYKSVKESASQLGLKIETEEK